MRHAYDVTHNYAHSVWFSRSGLRDRCTTTCACERPRSITNSRLRGTIVSKCLFAHICSLIRAHTAQAILQDHHKVKMICVSKFIAPCACFVAGLANMKLNSAEAGHHSQMLSYSELERKTYLVMASPARKERHSDEVTEPWSFRKNHSRTNYKTQPAWKNC